MSIRFLLIFILWLPLASFGQALKDGMYKIELHRKDGATIPFIATYTSNKSKPQLNIINATEVLSVTEFAQKGDSLLITLPFFESAFTLKVNANGDAQGFWVKQTATGSFQVPLTMHWNEAQRFPADTTTGKANVSGKWEMTFQQASGKLRPALGLLEQQGNKVTGSIVTPSGDYRFLEGVITNDSLYLSCFDGSHAYLFRALVKHNELVNGTFLAGATAMEQFKAVKNEQYAISDSSVHLFLQPGLQRLGFSFPDTKRKQVSLKDSRFKGKVVVIQILGSWCPNCMDETAFLSEFYNTRRSKKVEVLGLAYEYSTNWERSVASVNRFIDRFKVKYPILITPVSVNDPLRTEKTLPEITPIKVFPSTIFIGKDGTVKRFHTGFNGPGTGEYYQQFIKEFNAIIDELLAE